MNSKRVYLLVGLLGAFLILGLASAASVRPSPVSSPDPPGGDFVRRLPDYDSGWQTMDPGYDVLTLNHNLGGSSTDDYVVDLMFLNDDGAHHLSYGGDDIGSDENGAAWSKLNTTSVRVTRFEDDLEVDQVRLRIWVVPGDDYDSGWRAIAAGEAITLTHSVGGDPSDYLVYMEAKDVSATSPGIGVNHWYYGMSANRPNGAPLWYGFYWRALTTDEITLCRAQDDYTAEQVRARIWIMPEANYDSGWFGLTAGNSAAFDHGLGGPNNHLYVNLEFNSVGSDYAINQWCYGWVTVPPGYYYGATWHDLSAGSITVSRGSGDVHADKVRVRIWAPYRHWFPLGLRNH